MTDLDVMGVAEVAALIDRPRQTVAVWLHRDLMPEPDARLACGPVWRGSTVRRWAARNGFLP